MQLCVSEDVTKQNAIRSFWGCHWCSSQDHALQCCKVHIQISPTTWEQKETYYVTTIRQYKLGELGFNITSYFLILIYGFVLYVWIKKVPWYIPVVSML
jgi:hypothetical protein